MSPHSPACYAEQCCHSNPGTIAVINPFTGAHIWKKGYPVMDGGVSNFSVYTLQGRQVTRRIEEGGILTMDLSKEGSQGPTLSVRSVQGDTS